MSSSLYRLHPIPDGNYYIQAEHLDRFIRICKVQKMHIAFFIKLMFLKDLTNMFCNDCTLSSEQFSHLRLRQPHSIILHLHLQSRDLIRLIHDNLTGFQGAVSHRVRLHFLQLFLHDFLPEVQHIFRQRQVHSSHFSLFYHFCFFLVCFAGYYRKEKVGMFGLLVAMERGNHNIEEYEC